MNNKEYVKPEAEIVIFNVEDELTIIEGNMGLSGEEEGWM